MDLGRRHRPDRDPDQLGTFHRKVVGASDGAETVSAASTTISS
jgi:hypothetical protein